MRKMTNLETRMLDFLRRAVDAPDYGKCQDVLREVEQFLYQVKKDLSTIEETERDLESLKKLESTVRGNCFSRCKEIDP